MPTGTRSPDAAPPFEDHLRLAIQGLRTALADAVADVEADPTRPQELARNLGLDKSIAWHLSKILGTADAVAAVVHVPGRSGLRILERALRRSGAADDAVAALRDAIAGFEAMVATHCGDRATLDMMAGHVGSADRGAARDEAHRRRLFQGASAVWGVQARVQVSAHLVVPSADDPDRLDIAIISGLVGFRRLRDDVAWAIASLRSYSDDGSPVADPPREPLDPAADAHGVPLLRAFCSSPVPPLRATEDPAGTVRYEIEEGPVGSTGACTCLSGWIVRRCVSPWRTPHDELGEHTVQLSTPVKLLVHDLFVHRDVPFDLPPTAHLYSQLPGGPVYPRAGRDQGCLPLGADAVDLGAGPPDVTTPEIPRYRAMVEMAFARLGTRAADFAGYRLKLAHPPIPTLALFRHVLPEPPARA